MNKDVRDIPNRLAEAVADRSPVDWDREASDDPRVQLVITRLRALETIGSLYEDLRSTQGTKDTTETMPLEKQPAAVGSWGHLSLLRELGAGSYGEVFLARDENLKMNVALKLMRANRWPASEEDDFLQEARKLARVRHPNVVTVHGADRIDGRVGIWTEHIDGLTLEELLEKNGPFGAEETTHIGIILCQALAAVHSAGLVHGDVKTANVMREKGGRIVLLDFSTARDRPLEREDFSSVAGTPLFMAPESFQGKVSVLSDVYSLGVLLFRLVSGSYPVSGATLADIQDKHHRGDYVSLRDTCPHLPEPFVRVVEKALSPDPGDRYASAGEMQRALASLQGRSESIRDSQDSPAVRWSSRRRVALVGALAAAAAVVWLLVPRSMEVKAELFRMGPRAEERLQAGSRVSPGDQLFVEIDASRKVYVYIFNEDDSGNVVCMYPLDGLDLQNPLPAGEYRLPGTVDAVPNYWDVTSAGGSETILIVASKKPVDKMESALAQVSKAGEVTEPGFSFELETVRGVAGLSPRPKAEGETLEGMREGLVMRSGKDSDIWVWEIRLQNPSP